MIEDAGPGGKGKASTKFTERIAKHLEGWDLVKELSQTITSRRWYRMLPGLGPTILP
jgi:hypothetical protein